MNTLIHIVGLCVFFKITAYVLISAVVDNKQAIPALNSRSCIFVALSPYSDLDCIFQFVFAKENHIAATAGSANFPT